MRPSQNGDALQPFPYSTGPKDLMRPSQNGDALQPFPCSTGPKDLMRPKQEDKNSRGVLSFCAGKLGIAGLAGYRGR
jgi:hypothetical protein